MNYISLFFVALYRRWFGAGELRRIAEEFNQQYFGGILDLSLIRFEYKTLRFLNPDVKGSIFYYMVDGKQRFVAEAGKIVLGNITDYSVWNTTAQRWEPDPVGHATIRVGDEVLDVRMVVLHEMAHYASGYRCMDDHDGHGPGFVEELKKLQFQGVSWADSQICRYTNEWMEKGWLSLLNG